MGVRTAGEQGLGAAHAKERGRRRRAEARAPPPRRGVGACATAVPGASAAGATVLGARATSSPMVCVARLLARSAGSAAAGPATRRGRTDPPPVGAQGRGVAGRCRADPPTLVVQGQRAAVGARGQAAGAPCRGHGRGHQGHMTEEEENRIYRRERKAKGI